MRMEKSKKRFKEALKIKENSKGITLIHLLLQ